MSKKFNINEWILSVKYWSLLFIPHLSICLIFVFYILIGASIIQEIESEKTESSLLIKDFQHERQRLLIKIIEKRELFDLEQYTKYISKHLRQYEEEIKKQLNFEENSSLNFSKSLFFISSTLTTIGSKESFPKSKIGKLFLIFYTGFGIPLTLVFLTNLSYLIEQFIKYLSFIFFYFYSSKSIRFNEEDLAKYSSILIQNNLSITQLILTLFIYILIGSWFISSKSFFDSFYLCFTTIFTINLNIKIDQEKPNFIFIIIYLFFGLAIVLLYINDIKTRIERFLINIGRKLLTNLIELTRQMGFHDLTADDLSESIFPRHRYTPRTASSDQQPAVRPIGIAEPLRRLSTGLSRVFKITDNDEKKDLDKSVQVSTIIRRCGRCAETILPIQPVRMHSAYSTSSSSINDNNSSFEEDDIMEFIPAANFERIRQRRATLVAKTIINQMATQPRSSSIDELISPIVFQTTNRHRSADSSPIAVRCSVRVSKSILPESLYKRENNQEEFSQISKQISALITPNDDEN